MTEKAASTRRENTHNRHELIRQDFNTTYSQRVEGMKLDFDDVISKVASRHGFSELTVKRILKQ